MTEAAREPRTYDYELLFVVYRSRDLLEKLLATLPEDIPTVVVDNDPGYDGVEEVLRGRPATRYIEGPGRGFAVAANMAARSSEYDHLVLVNPDCGPTLAQIDALVDDLRQDPSLALVAATTTLPDGSIEIGVGGWEPTVRRALVHAVGLHKLFPLAGLWATPVPDQPIEMDWLGGAFMATPTKTFLDLGGYDESYFVYSEDVDFSRKVREAGRRQLVRTERHMLVPHIGAGSGEAKTRMLQMRGASNMQYMRRHRPGRTAVLVRAILTAGYGARYVVCRVRGRAATAAEHASYVRGMWVGPPEMSS